MSAICDLCKKNAATVHVTEVMEADASTPGVTQGDVHERDLCEACSQTLDLPHVPAMTKSVADIWKLLQFQYSAQQSRKKGGPVCPQCGMSLEEFRKKGRLGCPKDYEVFQDHILELLERVHGARAHVGRIPGTTEEALQRMQRSTELRQRLEVAIREEAYEDAARLRDELRSLEQPTPPTTA